MRRLFPKIATIALLGIVFLLGGVGTARAAGTCSFPSLTDKVSCETANGVWTETASSGTAITSTQGTGTATDVYMFGTNGTRFNSLSACQAAMGSNGPCVKTGTAYLQKTDTGPAELKGFSCGGLTFEIKGCFPIATYYLIYKPASYLLEGSGYIMDKMLSLSIEGKLVVPPFIDTSWAVVRDFSNMLFIFILLYTGIMTMFGAKDWRQTILWVIVMALLINFSLFFTKVVIDAGNILAVGVKSSITSGIPGQSISESLVGAFSPQAFLSTAGTDTSAMDAIIVFLVATIVSGFVAYVLFKVAILFSRRLIVFWGLMILSPFAFISIALPKKMNKFNEWLDALTSLSFVAPVFLFFLYLIMQVINAPALPGTSGTKMLDIINIPGGTWFTKLLGPVLVAALLVKALQEALKFTEDFAGTTGEAFSGLVSGAMGMAGGAALGATALGGRAIGGRIAQGLQEKGTFQKLATSDSAIGRFAGRQLLGMNEKARTGTWDVRGAEGFIGKNLNKGIKATGLDVGKVGADAKGGFEGAQKRQAEEDAKFVKKLKVTDEEKRKKAAELEPGYEDAVSSRAGRQKEEPAARKTKMETEKLVNSSPEGVRVNSAKEALKKQEESVKKISEDNAKKIADLEKQKSESALPETKVAIQKQIEEVQNNTQEAEKVRNSAKEELQSAIGTLAATAQGKALNKATEDLSAIENQIKEATEVIKSGDSKATAWAAEENKVRRGVQANYMVGRTGIAKSGIYGPTYSHTQAQKSADKIRSTTAEKESEEEKSEHDTSKLLEKALKKITKEETQAATTSTEKRDEDKH